MITAVSAVRTLSRTPSTPGNTLILRSSQAAGDHRNRIRTPSTPPQLLETTPVARLHFDHLREVVDHGGDVVDLGGLSRACKRIVARDDPPFRSLIRPRFAVTGNRDAIALCTRVEVVVLDERNRRSARPAAGSKRDKDAGNDDACTEEEELALGIA